MKKNLFKKCIFFVVIACLLMVVVSIMIKYDVEGEKQLPYSVGKIFLVSTVDGKVTDDPENIWNIGVTQVNDIYLYVDKTIQTDLTIKEVKIENFVITKQPQKGRIKLLRPTGDLNNLYTYSEQDYISGGIDYKGEAVDDLKALEISNTGGVLAFRLSLEELGTFISNENIEVTYDGKLLSNLGIKIEEIQFNISFDIIITTSDDVSYRGTLNLNLPIEDVIEKGSSNLELTDFENVIFKRI